MKRVLVIRLFALELVPMFVALALSAYSPRFMPAFLAAAAAAIFTGVILSIRDGAVLERRGFDASVCEREKDGRWFWFWIAVHASFGVLCFAGAALSSLPRR